MLACFAGFMAAQSVALDSTFGVNGVVETTLHGGTSNTYGVDFASFPDGKIIIGGWANGSVGLEKYDNLGNLDTSFSKTYVASNYLQVGCSVQKDGKILMV